MLKVPDITSLYRGKALPFRVTSDKESHRIAPSILVEAVSLTTNRYLGILCVNQHELLKTLICEGLQHGSKVPVHRTKERLLANNAHQQKRVVIAFAYSEDRLSGRGHRHSRFVQDKSAAELFDGHNAIGGVEHGLTSLEGQAAVPAIARVLEDDSVSLLSCILWVAHICFSWKNPRKFQENCADHLSIRLTEPVLALRQINLEGQLPYHYRAFRVLIWSGRWLAATRFSEARLLS